VSASGAYAGYINYFDIPIFASDCNTIKSRSENQITTRLIFIFLHYLQPYIYQLQRGQAQPHVYKDDLEKIKIPLPPKDIQQKIVKEYDAIDQEVEQAQKTIDKVKKDIEEDVTTKRKDNKPLAEVVLKISKTVDPNSKNGKINYIGLENIESQTGRLIGDIEFEYSEIKSNKTVFQKGDILYGKLRPNLNKVYQADFDGICSTDILVFRIKNTDFVKFYKYYLLSQEFNRKVLKTVSGQQLPRTSWAKINTFQIPVPLPSEQKYLVGKLNQQEQTIIQAQEKPEKASEQKQKILDKYLK
jgi:type I restriction enzyme M protein